MRTKGSLKKENKTWILLSDSFKSGQMTVPSNIQLPDDLNGKNIEFTNQNNTLTIFFEKNVYKKPEGVKQENKSDVFMGLKNNSVSVKLKNGSIITKPQYLFLDSIKQIPENSEIIISLDNRSYITSIQYNGKEYLKSKTQPYTTNNNPNQSGNQYSNNNPRPVAHAPYNFIKINEEIIDSEFKKEKLPSNEEIIDSESKKNNLPSFDKYHKEYLSGYIDLDIKAGKVFIGSNHKNNSTYHFFAPNGTPCIPGSSIRGMVKTLLEICTWAEFKNIDKDKRLFYRTFDTTATGEAYREKMLSTNSKGFSYPTVQAGYLNRVGNNYFIIPAEKDEWEGQFYRVEKNGVTIEDNQVKPVSFTPVTHIDQTQRHNGKRLHYALVTEITVNPQQEKHNGYLISTGWMYNKQMHWIINLPSDKKIEVSEDTILAYRDDATRKSDKNLYEEVRKNKNIPCFYLEDSGKVLALGHNPFFRIPYKNSIGNLLPDSHKIYSGLDIPTAIFGKEKNSNSEGFAGRVFFESALLSGQAHDFPKTYVGANTAISPKPTSVQLYLEQDNTNVNASDLKTYNNDDARLRGYKQYWHQQQEDEDFNYSFKDARVEFINLSEIELGALLFVLSLPEGCCHKIGMVKPGKAGSKEKYGSIKIKPTLYINNPEEKYKTFQLALENKMKMQKIQSYIDVFTKHIISELSKNNNLNISDLWEHDRLQQLKTMLNYIKPPTNTQYMDLVDNRNNRMVRRFNKQYKEKHILPLKPEDVK